MRAPAARCGCCHCHPNATCRPERMQTLIEFLANHWILTTALVTVLVLMVANEIWTAVRGE